MSRFRRSLIGVALAASCAVGVAPARAENPAKAPAAEPESVCGRALMTPEEVSEQRAKMWNAKTEEERQALRAAHHADMLERAKQKGVKLNPAGCPRGGMGRGGPPKAPPSP